MAIEELFVGLARGLQIAEALAHDAEVEDCGVEIWIELERAGQPGHRVVRFAEGVECEGVVIRGGGAERGAGVECFEFGRCLGVTRQFQKYDRAIESSLGERQRFLEKRERAFY